ncbi:MAG: hypothetical protein QOK25_1159 [Thermoleophilaceae bacterium]|jgi:hypothetical protein|nr:hypothetical protein [Thermoleophilaceae bacterium]
MGRTAALVGALVIIALLAFLTLHVALRDGVDVLVVISLLVLALVGVGVVGALNAPPDD